MKHPIRRRILYLGFQTFRAIVERLPLGAARALGRALGTMAWWLLGHQRRRTLAQLEEALGPQVERPRERRRIGRRVFQHLGENVMEWLLLPRLSSAQVQALIDCQGIEHLRAALAKGNGAIVVTAHFGNWELLPIYFASLGFQGSVLARRLRYPEYESFLLGMRGAKGVPTLARGSLKEVATILRRNQLIGMLPDQDIDSLEGVFVRFFHRLAYTPVGPAALSVMTGAPIVPCFILRVGGRFLVRIEPPVAAPATKDRQQTLVDITQAWSDVMESYIRRHPDHWVWMHRRWKTHPLPMTSDRPQVTGQATPVRPPPPLSARANVSLAALLVTCHLSLVTVSAGCGQPSRPVAEHPAAGSAADDAQHMSEFTLAGYGEDGTKHWELTGHGAQVEQGLVTISRPDGIGYDPLRQAYLTASVALVKQDTRQVRLEHDVTMHSSDGWWLTTPILYWLPDADEAVTDHPVRIESDHMLLRGRGARVFAELKYAVIHQDIEMVLNPTEHSAEPLLGGSGEGPSHVRITCDGPLTFDYERSVATFEQNVHVEDEHGDLYSDKLIAYLHGTTRTIRYAEAIGHVRIERDRNTATGERAIYEPTLGKVTLAGRPSLLLYPDGQGPGAELPFLGGSPSAPAAAPAASSLSGPLGSSGQWAIDPSRGAAIDASISDARIED